MKHIIVSITTVLDSFGDVRVFALTSTGEVWGYDSGRGRVGEWCQLPPIPEDE